MTTLVLASASNGTQQSGWTLAVIERDGDARMMAEDTEHHDWFLEGVEIDGTGEEVTRIAIELKAGTPPFMAIESWPIPLPLQDALARSFKNDGKVVRMKLDAANMDAIVSAFPAWAFV